MPYLDQAPLYNKISEVGAFDSNWTTVAEMTSTGSPPYAKTVLNAYLCPSDTIGGINTDLSNYGTSNYAGVVGSSGSGNTGTFYDRSKVKIRDITDGASNTAIVGERSADGTLEAGIWVGLITNHTAFYNVTWRMEADTDDRINAGGIRGFSSKHVGGAHFLFGDGRVRFLSENINGSTYEYLADIADGNVLGEY